MLGLTGKATSKIGEKVFKGRPIWQRAKPAQKAKREFGIPKRTDPDYKGEGRQVFRYTRAQPEVPPGVINRLYMTPTTATGQLARLGGTVAATNYGLGKVMGLFDDEETSDSQSVGSISTPGSGFPAQPSAPSYDIENRQAYQQRVQDKMNKDMRRLLQYYGIINLVNPDAAPNMLKLGTAMLQQDIEAMGSARQAKIFDAVFSDKPPTTAMEAYQRVMKAGGSVEDAEAISGMVADAMPAVSTTSPSKTEQVWELTNRIYEALQMGDRETARRLAAQGIAAKLLQVSGEHGMGLSNKQQAEKFLEELEGAAGSYNPSLAQGVTNIMAE
jgi:hypothetical protein